MLTVVKNYNAKRIIITHAYFIELIIRGSESNSDFSGVSYYYLMVGGVNIISKIAPLSIENSV